MINLPPSLPLHFGTSASFEEVHAFFSHFQKDKHRLYVEQNNQGHFYLHKEDKPSWWRAVLEKIYKPPSRRLSRIEQLIQTSRLFSHLIQRNIHPKTSLDQRLLTLAKMSHLFKNQEIIKTLKALQTRYCHDYAIAIQTNAYVKHYPELLQESQAISKRHQDIQYSDQQWLSEQQSNYFTYRQKTILNETSIIQCKIDTLQQTKQKLEAVVLDQEQKGILKFQAECKELSHYHDCVMIFDSALLNSQLSTLPSIDCLKGFFSIHLQLLAKHLPFFQKEQKQFVHSLLNREAIPWIQDYFPQATYLDFTRVSRDTVQILVDYFIQNKSINLTLDRAIHLLGSDPFLLPLDHALTNEAIQLVSQSFSDLLNSPILANFPDFILMKIIQSPFLNLNSNFPIYKVLKTWASKRGENLQEVLTKSISNTNFFMCLAIHCFNSGEIDQLVQDGILEQEQARNLKSYPWKEGLSFTKNSDNKLSVQWIIPRAQHLAYRIEEGIISSSFVFSSHNIALVLRPSRPNHVFIGIKFFSQPHFLVSYRIKSHKIVYTNNNLEIDPSKLWGLEVTLPALIEQVMENGLLKIDIDLQRINPAYI